MFRGLMLCFRYRYLTIRTFLLSSRLYCRFRNCTGSAALAGRGLSPPVGNLTPPRRTYYFFVYSIKLLSFAVNISFLPCTSNRDSSPPESSGSAGCCRRFRSGTGYRPCSAGSPGCRSPVHLFRSFRPRCQ